MYTIGDILLFLSGQSESLFSTIDESEPQTVNIKRKQTMTRTTGKSTSDWNQKTYSEVVKARFPSGQ